MLQRYFSHEQQRTDTNLAVGPHADDEFTSTDYSRERLHGLCERDEPWYDERLLELRSESEFRPRLVPVLVRPAVRFGVSSRAETFR